MSGPLKLLPEAIQRVPSVKYALAVSAVAGCVALALGYFENWQLALLGTLAGLVLMGLMVVFSQVAKLAAGVMKWPAIVFVWFCLMLFIVWAAGMTSSVFSGWPLELKLFASGHHDASSNRNLPRLGKYRCELDLKVLNNCFVEADDAVHIRFDGSGNGSGGVLNQLKGTLEPAGDCARARLKRRFATDNEEPSETDAGALTVCRRGQRWEGSWQETREMRFVMDSSSDQAR